MNAMHLSKSSFLVFATLLSGLSLFDAGWPRRAQAQVNEVPVPYVAPGEEPWYKRQIFNPQNQQAPIAFDPSPLNLSGQTLASPTSIQFGPDDRLYVSQQNGLILAFTIARNGPQDYVVTATEKIFVVKQDTPNHDDDGTPNSSLFDTGKGYSIDLDNTRQVTGLYVTGTPSSPILYVSSSDPRVGAGIEQIDIGLDTNSGVISRLEKVGGSWTKVDLVRGLPRSEENHSVNGLQLDEENNILYVAVGGLTNAGSPSNNFARITEYALSAAILSIDLDMIDAMPIQGSGNSSYIYDMPTLDDPTRENVGGKDVNDPFGGNNGLNQAKVVPGGPVQLHATGFRNPYDLVITSTPGKEGRMYSIDNGANAGWGGHPIGEGSYPGPNQGKCTNNYDPAEPGSTGPGPNDAIVNNLNGLHFIRELEAGKPYYGGHPTPVRGNPAGAGLYTYFNGVGIFRDSKSGSNPLPADWPPVPVSEAYAAECDFRNSGVDDGSLVDYVPSTNGLAEYKASNFDGAMTGALVSAGFDGKMFVAYLNEAGDAVTNGVEVLFSNFGSSPLDVTTQSDTDIFPGTIWAATYGSKNITVFEPVETACTGGPGSQDDDNDGYSNDDEIANGSDECNGGEKPSDFDVDFVSDLLDDDDDNDGILDVVDPFAIDADNGSGLNLPIDYDLFNNDPGTGFYGIGFTGLMTNGSTDYLDQIDENVIAGGTAGLLTVPSIPEGDAFEGQNDQLFGYQFGVNVNSSTMPFVIDVRIKPPFFSGASPQNGQSQGFYIGPGDQDNYLKVVLAGSGGHGGIQVVQEIQGNATSTLYADNMNGEQQIPDDLLESTVSLSLLLQVDPAAGTVLPGYSIDSGEKIFVSSPISLSGDVLAAVQNSNEALAVGVIATSAGPGPAFTATWDRIALNYVKTGISAVARINAGGPAVTLGGTTWSADQYYSGGGTDIKPDLEIADTQYDILYQTERFDAGQTGLTYTIPVPGDGNYNVALHFAEIYFQAPGKRVFSVSIEGNEVITDLDIFAEVGAARALVRTFENIGVDDGAVDITISSSVEHGKVSAIEVTIPGTPSPVTLSPNPINFYAAEVGGSSLPHTISILNNGTESISVTGAAFSGVNPGDFSTSFAGSFDIAPGASGSIDVSFAPSSAGNKAALLSISHTGILSPAKVTVNGEGMETQPGSILYRVNAGGRSLAPVDGYSIWSEDQASVQSNALGQAKVGAPSPFVNAGVSGNTTFGVLTPITLDASVPPSTPVDLFQTERWDVLSPPNMIYKFPVEAGTEVLIRLYFSEIFLTNETNPVDGPRLFDVAVDGAVPAEFNDIDVFAEAGANVGIMKSVIVESDGSVDIEFIPEASANQNPAIKGIELHDNIRVANEPVDEVPDAFRLVGNYPNPFNPSTHIVFELPEPAQVGIEVYDVMGRKVLDLPVQNFYAGTRQVRIDAGDLASGIYLYRVVAQMTTQTAVRTDRMTLVK